MGKYSFAEVKSKGSPVTSILNDVQPFFFFFLFKWQFKISFKVVYMYAINLTTLLYSGIQWHDMLDSFPFIDIQDFFSSRFLLVLSLLCNSSVDC